MIKMIRNILIIQVHFGFSFLQDRATDTCTSPTPQGVLGVGGRVWGVPEEGCCG